MLKHYYNGSLLTNAVLLADEQGFSAHAAIGEVDTCTVYVDDPEGAYDFVPYKVWSMVEDACTSGNQIVWHGYVGDQSIGRRGGEGEQFLGVARRWTVELIEDNGWPSRQILKSATANRPAETVSERLTWLLTQAEVSSVFVDHGLVEACTTDLDATNYQNRTAKDLLDDAALLSGYNYFVRWRESSSDLQLIFQAPASTADPAALTISNVLSDVDLTTVWAPGPDAVMHRAASRIASGILLPYDGGTTYDSDAATGSAFGLVDLTAPTSSVKTLASAQAQVTRLLAQHNEQDLTFEDVRLQLPAANLNDVKHGQLISSARFSHFPSPYSTGAAVRVKSRSFSRPPNQTQAVYDVDLKLTPTPTVVTFQIVSGELGGAGGKLTSFDYPVTAGSILAVAVTKRNTSAGGIPYYAFVGGSTGRQVTFNIAATGQVRAGDLAGPDSVRVLWVEAVGDEQSLWWSVNNIEYTMYELIGATSVGLETLYATAQAGSNPKSLGAFSTAAAGDAQVAGFIWDSGDPTARDQTVGTGWTEDQQMAVSTLHPGGLEMHSTSGPTAQITGANHNEWAAVAVNFKHT